MCWFYVKNCTFERMTTKIFQVTAAPLWRSLALQLPSSKVDVLEPLLVRSDSCQFDHCQCHRRAAPTTGTARRRLWHPPTSLLGDAAITYIRVFVGIREERAA